MVGERPVHCHPSVVSILSRLYPEIKFSFSFFFFLFQIRLTYMKEENDTNILGYYRATTCTSNAHLLSDIKSKRNSPVFPCTVRSFFERATEYGRKRGASSSPSWQGGSEASTTDGH